ncbi:TMAO/DMSO reductase [Nonomuraea coxensis DSM 45129]|uniref:TMAO/DMSO reductase n=1 Tax=Nonomuraea coxensis DSM 45129 TaxID=1122611 RepID=A0ABX8TWG3_9ACTN|nr:TMAO/DMSO reductase [Nonomuraea coxensis DSM 45129]
MPAWAGALAGLTAGGVALGLAQLVAGFFGPQTSPVVAVGDGVVDLSPPPVKDFAIRTFGENDKTVLVWGVLVLLAVVAAVIGVLARRRLAYGIAGLAAFGVVGLVAVVTRPTASVVDVLPTLVGAAAGMGALAWLLRRAAVPAPAVPEAPSGQDRDEAERPAVMRASGEPSTFDRRRLLTGVAGGVVVAGVGAVAGTRLAGSRAVDLARVNVALPSPATPARPIPAGADLRIGGLSSFVTPNSGFYRVDTALVVPQVDPGTWKLRIHGMVGRPVEITYDDLLRMPLTEADVTLTCVSNEVGGRLAGNARWLGVRMSEVLRRAGLGADADMLLSTSADGFTCGTPVDVVMDGREALFAIAMNGEPLPVEHGFPVRQVVPGLYGYVSATKWVVDVKVTRFDRDEAYWTPRGWSAKAPIKTQSRIDVPGSGASLKPGRTAIAGVAWAQHKGVAAVEVRVDGGAWQEARLAEVPGPDTWRQWSLDWDATPGSHTLQVRATDATGYTQTEQEAPPAPDGATGWHTITVRVA